MPKNFKDVSLSQYRDWIEYQERILARVEAGEFPYTPTVLADFKSRHENALRELMRLRDFYAEVLPNE
ncbi:hypothetical protein DXT89_13560 [Agrobacterium vitis]|uniref:Uncharacterized protein n=1 Tax=Agrobacterium vitis TaxID=373 RepID=A0A368NSR2_AGRVI|nr:hypothetical protein DXM22_07565 [Agrobacterium vitis]KAA3526963.1 hypothetical protein DXT89_13560 [Agrobacterium vitis]RCU53150.1 hypothetical protein ASB66_015890 [Agrobacterium vitis]